MIRIIRLLTVPTLSLTAYSLGLGLLSLSTFSLLGWIVPSAEIFAESFAGIAIFALCDIGCNLVFMWVFNADEDESFWTFLKDIIKSLAD